MRMKGHLSLLPNVVRALEREPETGTTVVVAHEKDVSKMHKKFPDARVEVDEKIVGGYIQRSENTVTDASFRHALVTLYQNTTR
jgi:F0F1-type ATP synthase delta subunit